MTAVFPDWPQKMLALQEAVHWSSNGRVTTIFRDSNQGGRVRKLNQPWIELAMDSITSVGQDEICNVEVSPSERREVVFGTRQFTVECRTFSREQDHASTAWYLLDTIRTRLRTTYVYDKWFRGHGIAIVNLPAVVNLTRPWQDRHEGEAVLELQLSTVVSDNDPTNAGTWIDTVLLSGTVGVPGIDLVDEVIGAPLP